MVEPPQGKQYSQRFWNEITPESLEANLSPRAWRHEATVNRQIQVYAQLHLLQQLMDSLPVCISYVDQNRNYQYANITYQTWFGLKPEEIYGQPLEVVIGTAAYQKVKPYVDRALAGETVTYETTLPYLTEGQRYVQATLVPDGNADGTVRGYFGLIQDLSDRKAAEIALQRKVDRENTLWQITQRIRQTLDLPSILVTATEEVQRHLQVDRTFIFQFTSNHTGEIIQATTKSECPLNPSVQLWQEEGLRLSCLHCYGQGTVKSIVDMRVDHEQICLDSWMEPMAAKSAIIAPVLQPQAKGAPELWGFLVVQTCGDYRQWHQGEAELLQQVADQLAIAVQQSNLLAQVKQQSERLTETNRALEEANQRLNKLSRRDGLTQIANRRQFDAVLRREWKRLSRSHSPLSLIMFDVDHFKHYNDRYGHPAGDDCLRTIARTSQQVVKRPSDVVARYGGEEFAVILPNTSKAGALRIAETIRKSIRDLNLINFETDTETIYVTVSLGVACQIPTPKTSPQGLIDVADQALYRAKEEGRNRSVMATSEPA